MYCFRLGSLEATSEMRVWGQIVYVGGDPRKTLEGLRYIREGREWKGPRLRNKGLSRATGTQSPWEPTGDPSRGDSMSYPRDKELGLFMHQLLSITDQGLLLEASTLWHFPPACHPG